MNKVSIVGTRPQFIKAAILAQTLEMDIIDTGQHYDHSLAGQYLDEFRVKAERIESAGDVSSMYKELMWRLTPYDTVIVYGDCNTTLAGALAADFLDKQLVHVEAGCRSFNRRMVEESIRITVDHLADLNLCPTETALWNLKDEEMGGVFTGDLSQDYIERCAFPFVKSGSAFVTIHRAENLENMDTILEILEAIERPMFWPQHPKMKKYKLPPNITPIEPLPYREMIDRIYNAPFIITDSGGLQKEAYMLKTKCITLREDTEWPETLHNGWNTLAMDKDTVLKALDTEPGEWIGGLFGNNAAERMKDEIERLD